MSRELLLVHKRPKAFFLTGLYYVVMLLFLGCSKSGEELFSQSREAAQNKDFERSEKLLLKAVEKEYPEALFFAGKRRLLGEGVEPDATAGLLLIRKAAELGLPEAMFTLGVCYEKGIGAFPDKDKAKFWLGRAVQADHAEAMFTVAMQSCERFRNLFVSRLAGSGGREISYTKQEKADMANNIGLFQRLIDEPTLSRSINSNDLITIYMELGRIYLNGIAVNQDIQKALNYYSNAVDMGDPFAASVLGSIYCEGKLCEKDYDKGVPLLKKGLEKRDDFNEWQLLGVAYLDPNWVKSDLGEAITFFKKAVQVFDDSKAANSKDYEIRESLYWLGRILAFEDEQFRDVDQGIKYLERANEAHSADARYFLGLAYYDGVGVKKDLKKAWEHFRMAELSKDKEIVQSAKELAEEVEKILYPNSYKK